MTSRRHIPMGSTPQLRLTFARDRKMSRRSAAGRGFLSSFVIRSVDREVVRRAVEDLAAGIYTAPRSGTHRLVRLVDARNPHARKRRRTVPRAAPLRQTPSRPHSRLSFLQLPPWDWTFFLIRGGSWRLRETWPEWYRTIMDGTQLR